MLKAKEFKALIGFDHTKVVLIFILISGMAFPFIFLDIHLDGHGEVKQWFRVMVGLLYASVLTIGNLHIFYFYKTKKSVGFLDLKPKDVVSNLSSHMAYTLIAATVMFAVPMNCIGISLGITDLIRNIIGACLFVALYIGFYEAVYYLNALKNSVKKQEQLKRENVESQLEILKNQVKPHFLFNSLNTLASLIPEDSELAVDYVHNLAKVYRYVLEIKDKKLIPVAEELNCVKAYLFMLQIRFGENLIYKIKEKGLDHVDHIVPLSLQLLVENAVKHNVISSKKPLTILIEPKDNKLMVSNNLQPKIQVAKSTGTGLANIRSRYEILTNLSVQITKTANQFTVALPLIDVR